MQKVASVHLLCRSVALSHTENSDKRERVNGEAQCRDAAAVASQIGAAVWRTRARLTADEDAHHRQKDAVPPQPHRRRGAGPRPERSGGGARGVAVEQPLQENSERTGAAGVQGAASVTHPPALVGAVQCAARVHNGHSCTKHPTTPVANETLELKTRAASTQGGKWLEKASKVVGLSKGKSGCVRSHPILFRTIADLTSAPRLPTSRLRVQEGARKAGQQLQRQRQRGHEPTADQGR